MTEALNRAMQIMTRYVEMTGGPMDSVALTDVITDLALWGYSNGLDSADAVRSAMETHVPAER
ncbi:hypothetical protein [Streptomyces sp. NBC_01439]|uniref:hypothetical protein n=1 Tax=Streptomyces sp. NBC_01439 TaxID=2903867 RepID=UPI002E2CD1CF|nr:hypothetical protein [Streptomyces sp. NBC_01439]